jgi:hypothetical protein
MLQVVFYNSTNTEKIENFRHISFSDAVALTENVERECRKEKQSFQAEFQITDLNGNIYYRGIFAFGSYDYQNIYHQLRETAPKIKLSKDREHERQFLLEQIEKLTPAAYKEIELVDKTFINLEKTNISKLKKWQRFVFYSLTPIASIGCIALGFMFSMQQSNFNQQLANEVEKAEINKQLIENYEAALQGNKESYLTYLETLSKENKLTENQQVLLINQYLVTGAYDKAVALNDDVIYVETLLLANKELSDTNKKGKIATFNELYPTNEARFDLAYFEKNYDLLLNVENVNMTVQRSEMKTYAYLKLGKVEQAKKELNNNSNSVLSEKIVRYEILAAEIKTLQTRLGLVSGAERNEISNQIAAKEQEIAKL